MKRFNQVKLKFIETVLMFPGLHVFQTTQKVLLVIAI